MPEENDIETGETCNAKCLIIPGEEEIEYISQFIDTGSKEAPSSVSEEVPQVDKYGLTDELREVAEEIYWTTVLPWIMRRPYDTIPDAPPSQLSMFNNIRTAVHWCTATKNVWSMLSKQDQLKITKFIVNRLRMHDCVMANRSYSLGRLLHEINNRYNATKIYGYIEYKGENENGKICKITEEGTSSGVDGLP